MKLHKRIANINIVSAYSYKYTHTIEILQHSGPVFTTNNNGIIIDYKKDNKNNMRIINNNNNNNIKDNKEISRSNYINI